MRKSAVYKIMACSKKASFAIQPKFLLSVQRSLDIQNKINLWEQYLITCQSRADLSPDPSIIEPGNSKDHCSYSDMNLFNGLLCVVGEQRGCLAVQRAQTADGRWWRSPFRALNHNCDWRDVQNKIDPAKCKDTTFSKDMALGTQLYAAITHDKKRFQHWLNWIEKNRPCSITNPITKKDCIKRGTPRWCIHANCIIDWPNALMLTETSHFLGLSVPEGVDGLKTTNLMSLSKWIEEEVIQSNEGIALHIAGVKIFLLKKILHRGDSNILDQAAVKLSKRQPANPFYSYLVQGPNAIIWDMVSKVCPDTDSAIQIAINEPNSKFQTDWAWQRADKVNAWKESSLWDCLFMAKLLLKQDNFSKSSGALVAPTGLHTYKAK